MKYAVEGFTVDDTVAVERSAAKRYSSGHTLHERNGMKLSGDCTLSAKVSCPANLLDDYERTP